jgi:two-component system, OmpR family, phosphate regulon sensor histidine kinase PhoR
VTGFLRRRARTQSSADAVDGRVAAERARVLLEESRESVVVLDADRRVVAASRRAREALQGLAEGAPFPDALLSSSSGRAALEIPLEVEGLRETLLYLSSPGDLVAYEELRAGFTAAVSHELRTPLARLMALLDSVSLPEADAAGLVEQARSEVIQMGELIDDVLFLSELESGRVVVSLGSTPALAVLERAIEGLAARAEAAGMELALICPASVELPLRQRMLEVVAVNLVENAIRYAGEGAKCAIEVTRDGTFASLAVSDNGRGVPEQDLPRLFERFFRSDRARATRGTGLGLAIVKHIVTSAGGRVEARNLPGAGLEVRCTFPTPG